MAGKVESLKEYLVKLGWDVDELGLSKLQNGLSKVERSADSIGNKFVKNFAKAGTAAGGFLMTITTGTAKFMSNVAMADLATERWARRMWTTEENARSLTAALDAMGASYEDIFYMTPEEYKNMLELKNFASSLKAPAELEDTLKQIRDINQEINKTKVILSMATRWIAYYLGQYLGKDFKNAQEAMKEFNNYLVEKLPVVTEKIAKYISWIVRLAKVAIQFIKNMKERLQNIFDKMPSGFKTATLAATAFLGALKMGPLGLFIAGITALLLLLDDYYTYQRGGKSAFDWGNLFGGITSNASNWIDDLDDTKESVENLKESLKKCKTAWGNVLDAAMDYVKKHDLIDKALSAIVDTADQLVQALTNIADLISVISGNWDKVEEGNFWKEAARPLAEEGFSWGGLWNLIKSMGIATGNRLAGNRTQNDLSKQTDLIDQYIYDKTGKAAAYSAQMNANQASSVVGGTTTNSNVKNDNRRQTANINVNVKSYGNSDTASQTARGVSKALQDVDVFK